MKISLVIISTLLVLCVFVPFIIFIYNGTKNTLSIKKQAHLLIKNNGIIYSVKDVWRKNFIGISSDNKTLTYIHFKLNKPFIIDISLADLKQCHIIKNYNNGTNKTTSLKSLDLEFIYKSASKPNTIINFFNVDDDLNEDFEWQRIEKWQQLIKASIPQQIISKIAS
ncbi:hypothetical protein [Confluentibacter sediminis]|uniref:hypothetical protein n=1 Tax=Confluentibacter sediminis TaxID=2219045 RepID=UPI000DAEF12A|nr:hypothetical protein [Confluentibacter sediminis]